jgi:hypothetical protein
MILKANERVNRANWVCRSKVRMSYLGKVEMSY